MKAIIKNNEAIVNFSNEEVIVLLEWLHNFNEGNNSHLFGDQAEQRILWDLEAELENITTATFDDNYIEILSKAREKIRDRD